MGLSLQTNINPARTHATLTALPTEIFNVIVQFTDRASALSLSRVSRQCHNAAHARIWRELRLITSENCGKTLIPDPYQTSLDSIQRYQRRREDKADTSRNQIAVLQEVVNSILEHGDEKRWNLVKEVVLVSGAARLQGITDILRLVSPKLSCLDVPYGSDQSQIDESNHPPTPFMMFFIETKLSFPALTQLRLGRNTIRFVEDLPVIFNSSPNIRYFELKHFRRLLDPVNAPMPIKFTNPSKIHTMRLTINARSTSQSIGLRTLLENSPDLRDVNICYRDGKDPNMIVHDRMARILSSCSELRRLIWESAFEALLEREGRTDDALPPSFPKVKHLMCSGDWTSIVSFRNF